HEVEERAFEQATETEIADTIKVMGGEDWAAWVAALREAGLLAGGFRTVAYSYVGPGVTQAVYRFGTIGRAKEHLEATAHELAAGADIDGAWVSINTGAVTQASAAIPGVPLYISVLFKEMKSRGLHESAIDQLVRLFRDHIGPGVSPSTDEEGRIRLDDREMLSEVQSVVENAWHTLSTENLYELSDYAGYQRDFRRLFGFDVDGIDYEAPTEVHRELGRPG
ncbi:MAG: bifunctional NADH-specific enoyl-ACP reductase/trans-2-enoyl-CoA reductase, partial [Dehalococcoidia bacterium]|nr:bifunctional NADH-specific enoyl-ACP reductase/trans-2-enoyl-CoA reductase [Dehalococcoidia bacterium]